MYSDLINEKALKYKLRPDIVACIIIQESQGNTFAWRFEEAWHAKNLANKTRGELSGLTPYPLPSLYDEKIQRGCSFGLMQVLGETARSICKMTQPYLTCLCDPEIGIDAGCKVLSYYLKLCAGDYTKALTRYNGSSSYPNAIYARLAAREHLSLLRTE